MKKILIFLLIISIMGIVAIYTVYSYRNKSLAELKVKQEYENYYNIEVLGTELISIINKTIDLNHKNGIEKDENQLYIDNGKNSIKINIVFNYQKETKTIPMENIEKNGIETFVRVYSTASFKCTNIEYHSETKNVKSLTFEQVAE